MKQKFLLKHHKFTSNHIHSCDCSTHNVSIENVMDAICRMKQGKCADDEGLVPEHFHHAPFGLIQRLVTLFNQMLKHGYVPNQFRFGFMIPIIKDNQGNHSDLSNYRGITISPITSKVFEHVLKIVFSSHLPTSSYQFGFKKKSSTIHALHCFRETVEYFINNESRVYCSFLDASKAFDRVIHSGLFIKLMNKNVPKVFVDIMMT